jgi:hypothetical protein
MVKGGGQPTGGGVATLAGDSIPPGMLILIRMAGITICWSTQVNMADVAGFTGSGEMGTSKFEGSQIMIKKRRDPPGYFVTGVTNSTKATLMNIIVYVTCITVFGCSGKEKVRMARLTRQEGMFAQQLKIRPGMIKDGWRPPDSCVTQLA